MRTADLDAYAAKLLRLATVSDDEFNTRLGGARDCGAFPSDELWNAADFIFTFGQNWTNHEDARRWAFEVLQNRTTFAADGSQLFIDREVTMPVAAVQIGWFENSHRADGVYEKNARFIILSPSDLLSADEPAIPETRVSERRFREEIETAQVFLRGKRGWRERGERMPVAFYDGTLFLSIALERTQIQSEMIERLVGLVRTSKAAGVPIVGFVDRSYARDLMTLADRIEGRDGPSVRTIDDVSVISSFALPSWGDRSPFFFGRRRGLEFFIDDDSGESIAGFVYLRTTAGNPPARIDVPTWVYRDGLLDEVLDVVRAECVIGLGYPYPIEAADQTAVITHRDREVFLHALQGFAKENSLDFRISRKAASKGRRR
jgi:hypothetical protein